MMSCTFNTVYQVADIVAPWHAETATVPARRICTDIDTKRLFEAVNGVLAPYPTVFIVVMAVTLGIFVTFCLLSVE